jgi:hypothetical protein
MAWHVPGLAVKRGKLYCIGRYNWFIDHVHFIGIRLIVHEIIKSSFR